MTKKRITKISKTMIEAKKTKVSNSASTRRESKTPTPTAKRGKIKLIKTVIKLDLLLLFKSLYKEIKFNKRIDKAPTSIKKAKNSIAHKKLEEDLQVMMTHKATKFIKTKTIETMTVGVNDTTVRSDSNVFLYIFDIIQS